MRDGKSIRVPTDITDKDPALAIRQKLQRAAEQQRAGTTLKPLAQ